MDYNTATDLPIDDNASYSDYATYALTRRSGILLNYSLTNAILVGLSLFFVIFVTAFGNFLVGLSLFRYRSLRTISNYLIGNLALSDFLLAITILPLSTVNECLGHWVFGRVACNLWLITDVLYCTASIWNICIIAFDRFTATFYPMWYRDKRSAKQAALYVGIVWVIATSVSVPPLLGWNDLSQNYQHKNETDVDECTIFQTHSYVLYSACGSFFVPFFITFALYVRIFGVLRQRMIRSRSVRSSRRKALVQSSASSAVIHGEYPLEKTPLCKTITLETTASASPTRNGTTARDCCAGGLDETLSVELLNDGIHPASLRVKLYGTNDRLVTEIVSPTTSDRQLLHNRDAAAATFPPNGDTLSFVSRLSSDADLLSTQLRATAAEQKLFLSPCDGRGLGDEPTNGSGIIDDPTSSTDNCTNCGDFETSPRRGGRSPSSRRRRTGRDALLALRQCSTSGGDLGSSFSRNESPSPRRCRPRMRRALSSSSDPVATSRGGGNQRHARKQSVVNAFRNIGSLRSLRESWTAHQQNFEQMEMKATVRMAFIIAAFCGMWLGFFTIYVLNSWCESCRIPRELDAFFFWLGYLNSTVNPILYAIFNEEFRKAFKKILGLDRRRNSGRGASGGSGGGSGRGNLPRRK